MADDMAGSADVMAEGDNGLAPDGTVGVEEPVSFSETGESTPTGEQQAATATTWVGDDYPLKFRGRTVIPPTREDLISWAQLGYNAKDRMQTLEQREGSLKERETKLDQVQKLAEAFEQVPQFKKQVFEIYQKIQSGDHAGAEAQIEEVEGQAPAQTQPLLDKISSLNDKIAKLEGRFSSEDQRRYDDNIKQEIDTLKTSHADHEWDLPDEKTGKTLLREFVEFAAENSFNNLENAYKVFFHDEILARAKANALKEAQNLKKQEAQNGVVGKGGPGTPPKGAKQIQTRGKSYDQLAMEALNEWGK